MINKRKILPFYFCLIFVLIFSQVIHIYALNEAASSESYISLDLDKTDVRIGDVIKASVRINQINNFVGYQANIKYDPTVLQPINPDTGVAFTDKTPPLTGNILVNTDYVPYYYLIEYNFNDGILNFARMYSNFPAYLAGGNPETSGILAIIGFKVISSSTSKTSIRFEDNPSMQSSVSGTIVFDSNFENIPNYTVSQAPDINILTDNPTPTTLPKYKISGYIAPDIEIDPGQSADLKSGFKVEVIGTSFTAQTNSSGFFELTDIPFNPQGYSLKISKDNYLNRIINNVSVIDNNVQIASSDAPLSIWAGDMKIDGDQDNAINMADIMELTKGFNSMVSDARYNANYDFNKDNAINMTDIIILAKHFNKTASDYPNS